MKLAAFEKMEKNEDLSLSEKAHQTLKRIEAGSETTSSWEKAKKRLLK